MTFILAACQNTSTPQFNEAMGWTLDLVENGLYAELTVVPGAYADEQGFKTGDLILLENYEPGVSEVDGVEQPVNAEDYLKAFTVEVCGAGVSGAFGESLEFEVQRAGELIQIQAKDIPRMECA